ncbi:MAG TPA: hypothetical protein VL181_05030 [Holophagaceae bacterium]|nr:hypothetical protein [Holophagaceae bacterium]
MSFNTIPTQAEIQAHNRRARRIKFILFGCLTILFLTASISSSLLAERLSRSASPSVRIVASILSWLGPWLAPLAVLIILAFTLVIVFGRKSKP